MFLAGILSCMILISVSDIGIEKPFFIGSSTGNTAPSDWIKENQISVFQDKIVISIENAGVSEYADTGSMKPTLDEKSNGIRIAPKNSEQISVGDIVTFERDGNLIVHRVTEKGKDDKGDWFITKGDNNRISDGKIRFSDIKYVTIGILW